MRVQPAVACLALAAPAAGDLAATIVTHAAGHSPRWCGKGRRHPAFPGWGGIAARVGAPTPHSMTQSIFESKSSRIQERHGRHRELKRPTGT